MARFTRIPSSSSGRRSFLAQAGLCGSALAGLSAFARPSAATAASSTPVHAEGRIGLLLPPAKLCRGLDSRFLAGFQMALDQVRETGGRYQLELVMASTTFSPSSHCKAAEKLLQEERADLVIAIAQPAVVSAMAPAFEEAQRCLLAVDGGANLVRMEERSPHVFYNTLGQWQSLWALGRWAARTYQGEGFLVASAFETGHDSFRAFRMGVDATGTGERGFHVPRMPLQQAMQGLSPAESMDQIRRSSPAYVLALLGRTEGRDFLQAFQQAGLNGQIPLVGSVFLAEEAIAQGLGNSLAGFITASAWTSALPTPANRAFRADYQRRNSREADSFAALGFDTGLMLLAAMQDSGGHARFVRQALEQVAWEGPGGQRRMDFASHSVQGDIHLARYDSSLRPVLLRSDPALANHAQEVDALLRARRPALVNPYPVY